MFALPRLIGTGAVLVVLVLAALGAARPTTGAGPHARYVVEAGDTLWGIAEAHYGGDPREAVWRIRERNGLADAAIQPGDVLVLPPG